MQSTRPPQRRRIYPTSQGTLVPRDPNPIPDRIGAPKKP
ncbi:hypothetical protein F8B43_4819 [Methylorubrum populi]|uniref:Uncharacterized protein n=1 Tax=Methylorubrum populi TaxID=223967 RepID=A0A833J0V2_9HYPH|nr:hypothetical protein F8B43_4819 [Methylorubrum populi]